MFQIDVDADGKCFVYQAKDEMDRTHSIDNNLPGNDGRMYDQPYVSEGYRKHSIKCTVIGHLEPLFEGCHIMWPIPDNSIYCS